MAEYLVRPTFGPVKNNNSFSARGLTKHFLSISWGVEEELYETVGEPTNW